MLIVSVGSGGATTQLVALALLWLGGSNNNNGNKDGNDDNNDNAETTTTTMTTATTTSTAVGSVGINAGMDAAAVIPQGSMTQDKCSQCQH